MPAAAVIPAPIAYIKVVAVKKLVVGFRGDTVFCVRRGGACSGFSAWAGVHAVHARVRAFSVRGDLHMARGGLGPLPYRCARTERCVACGWGRALARPLPPSGFPSSVWLLT